MGDATTIVDAYLAMWNETDPKRRAALIERAWAGDGRYADPMLEASGHAALAPRPSAARRSGVAGAAALRRC